MVGRRTSATDRRARPATCRNRLDDGCEADGARRLVDELRRTGGEQRAAGVEQGGAARLVERQGHRLIGDVLDRAHEEVHAGQERCVSVRCVGDHHGPGSERLGDQLRVARAAVRGAHVEHDTRPGQRLPACLVERLVSGRIEQPQLGAPLPQLAAGAGEEPLAPGAAPGDEGDVDGLR